MKIKEVEKRVGITRANIRYYEKEGLLTPVRDGGNNYREYSGDDVSRLEQIKVLRILGVSIADIRSLGEGRISLEEVMDKRLEEISEEEQSIQKIRKACEAIRLRGIEYDEIDERVLEPGQEIWKEQLRKLLHEDITKEILTPEQLNRNLAVMLGAGYLVNALIAFLLGESFFEGVFFRNLDLVDDPGLLFFPILGIAIFCYVSMYFIKSVKLYCVIFATTVMIQTPLLEFLSLGGKDLVGFWMLMAGYVGLLYFLSVKRKGFFEKARYTVFVASVFSCIVTVLMGLMGSSWITMAVLSIVFTLYIGLNWFHTYEERGNCTRYYAIMNGSRIMNIGGVVFQMFGKTSTSNLVLHR